jgi:hypothetical protein
MKKGFAVCAVLMTLGHGLAGCGGSNNPFSPSPPPSQPPPLPPLPPPPLPPRTLAVDLTGTYALTFDVGNACEQIPQELRTRTYEANLSYNTSYASTDVFLAGLSGATLHDQPPVWVEVTHGASGSAVWLNLVDTVVFEEPERGTYFMISGGGGGASIAPTQLSTISTSFTGYFNYCVVGPQNQCSFDAMVRSLCKSEHSEWTLTRR